MTRLAHWLTGLFLLLAVFTADARVIFDNGVTEVADLAFSDRRISLISADDFMLAPGSPAITGIRWSGFYVPAGSSEAIDNFSIEIFPGNNVAPMDGGSPISVDVYAVKRTGTGVYVEGFDPLNFENAAIIRAEMFRYEAVVSPQMLAANTVYWLAISNNTTGDPDNTWYWGAGGVLENSYIGVIDGTMSWVGAYQKLDFQLTAVPEPETAILLGIGLLAFALATGRTPGRTGRDHRPSDCLLADSGYWRQGVNSTS